MGGIYSIGSNGDSGPEAVGLKVTVGLERFGSYSSGWISGSSGIFAVVVIGNCYPVLLYNLVKGSWRDTSSSSNELKNLTEGKSHRQTDSEQSPEND